jgi:membrane glycosyltransferase
MKSPLQTDRLSRDVISFRHALFLATGGGITLAGAWLMAELLRSGGVTLIEGLLLALFLVLFGQIAFGFSIALWGFAVNLLGGDRYEIMNALPEGDSTTAPRSTAVVMPIFNENVHRVFKGVENMFRSVAETECGDSFDFFVLSDSSDPDRWVEEEYAWADLCARLGAFGRIFYRKRRVSLHGKSGNIADFCRRWGRRYHYLVILDADSILTGATLVRLVRVMDGNPKLGIVQTAPRLVRGVSVLQRLIQFSARVVGPLFAAGSNFWHLAGGNYWGHNAIIRLRPFMEHCVLPELPTREDRHILSHDTVEAALMQQAGYQVWLAYLEEGSYEEGPPNLTESLRRDRRWCQGNLQHLWFLFAPGTHFTNRIHMFLGLMAYLAAPLLVVFVTLGAIDYYWKQRFALFSSLSADATSFDASWNAGLLLAITITLLFLPKLLGLILIFRHPRPFGGALRAAASTLLETLASVLLAPTLLYFYTKFVVLALFRIRVGWSTQNRLDSRILFRQAARDYFEPTALGVTSVGLTVAFIPGLLPWLSPLLLGWCLAIPLAMITSSEFLGRRLREYGLLLTPEETNPPPELDGLDTSLSVFARPAALPSQGRHGTLMAVMAPYANAIHVILLRRRKPRARRTQERLDGIRDQFLRDGPRTLSRRDLLALLWDPGSLGAAHRQIWTSDESQIHTSWRRTSVS